MKPSLGPIFVFSIEGIWFIQVKLTTKIYMGIYSQFSSTGFHLIKVLIYSRFNIQTSKPIKW